MFEFEIIKKSQKSTLSEVERARTGIFRTPHGNLETPELAFVATEGELKTIPKKIFPKLPVKLIIVNTFHIWVKKLLKKIHIHEYAHFQKPIMSDSGGFQVFSMGFGKSHHVGKIGGMFPGKHHATNDRNNPLKITENGVEFTFNNKKMLLTPEKSIQIQKKIGADIMFAFDECTSPLNSKTYTRKAMKRTHQWLQRCLKVGFQSDKQALFAIVQGGYFKDLRKQSAHYVGKLDVPGFGIGGSLGTTEEEVRDVLDWTIPYLPENKPRHLLGIGKVKDIFDAVERGIDLFDCVIPTREARHKVIYTKKGKFSIRKMKNSNRILERNCRCMACSKQVTWKQLAQLFSQKHPKAFFYATVHNIQFFSDLMKNIREGINKNRFRKIKEDYCRHY